MKRLLILVAMICVMLSVTTFAEDEDVETFTSGDYEYALLEDGTAMITKYNGEATELEVPSELDGYAVTSIGEMVFGFFSYLSSITLPDSIATLETNPFLLDSISISVSPDHPYLAVIDGVLFSKPDKRLIYFPGTKEEYTVPNGILSIGDKAFAFCSDLISITLPEGLTSIADLAFGGCSSLNNITLPDSIATIGVNPFSGDNIRVSVSPDHPYLAVIDGVLFSKPDKRLIYSPDTKEDYTVPNGIQNIGNYGFSGCSLSSITLPEGVVSIGDSAFSSCSNLSSITLPDSLTNIGEEAFGYCKSLSSITLPESITSIGENAFSGCDDLIITVNRGSYAAEYCKENGLNYTYPDINDWLNS